MKIYVEHDAKVLANLSGVQAPGCDGIVTRHGQADDVLASTMRSNPLGGQWLFDIDAPGDWVVSWSGTLAEDLFQPHPMTWLSPGHEALGSFCDEIAPQLARHGKTLIFQPHSRHVLNDPHSCRTFLEQRDGQPFAVALAPASMIEVSMLSELEDHLHRVFELLGGRCAAVMLRDVQQDEVDDQQICECPLGDGLLPRELVQSLLDQHVPAEVPVVLQPGKIEQQLAWLGVSMPQQT